MRSHANSVGLTVAGNDRAVTRAAEDDLKAQMMATVLQVIISRRRAWQLRRGGH
jgi:hypothetical protein